MQCIVICSTVPFCRSSRTHHTPQPHPPDNWYLLLLSCIPSLVNPPVDTVCIEIDGSPVTSGDSVIVTGNTVTISSVQKSHSGNYSCTANNTRGSTVIYQYLLVADGGEREEAKFSYVELKICGIHVMAHETNPYNSCSNELQRCVASQSCSCAAVPLIARVAVQFVTSSSLEVVTHLTTNGGRDVLRYYVCG